MDNQDSTAVREEHKGDEINGNDNPTGIRGFIGKLFSSNKNSDTKAEDEQDASSEDTGENKTKSKKSQEEQKQRIKDLWRKVRDHVVSTDKTGGVLPLAEVVEIMEPVWKSKANADNKDVKPMDEQYWLEVLDPKHRWGGALAKHHKVWQSLDTDTDFFTWLDIDKGYRSHPKLWPMRVLEKLTSVSILEPEEREDYAVIANDDGKLIYKKSGELVHLPKTYLKGFEGIYVISPDMVVYMGRKVAGRFHHSTFLAGGPVLCGGTIAVSHGELRELTNASGHYKPSKQQLEAADRLLKKMGAKGEWSLKRPYDDDDDDD